MNLSATLLKENNALADMSQQAGSRVTKAIYTASEKSGVDFGYLMKQAKVESSFDVDAQAKTSSARGLYQFLNGTWMEMIQKYGDKYGIDTNQSKQALLKLRDDPAIAANMAAEFAGQNKTYLEKTWGGDVGATEQYLAHFMGAGGAASFLKAMDANPLQPAAELFERAANANKSIFFDKETKRAKTLEEVYLHFDQKFQDVQKSSQATTQIAETTKPDRDSLIPLYSFSEKVAAFADRAVPLKDTPSLFANLPSNNNWLRVSSIDFVNLLKNI